MLSHFTVNAAATMGYQLVDSIVEMGSAAETVVAVVAIVADTRLVAADTCLEAVDQDICPDCGMDVVVVESDTYLADKYLEVQIQGLYHTR